MSKNKTMVTDLTQDNVVKLLLTFAFPLFVSNALQAVYNLVDMVVVGQYIGGAGMSAVSIGGEVLHLLTFVAMGFSSAGQVLIAQRVGASDMDGVRKMIGTMFTSLLAVSLLISAGCILFRDGILNGLNTPVESYAFTMDYMLTCAWGLVFIYGYNIVSAIMRGMGDSKRPFMFVAIAAVLNMILDIIFVVYLDMKVFGAALATVIGQAVSFVIAIVYLYRRRESFGFDFRPESFRIDRQALGSLMALGIPMAIQSAAINISKIVLTAWINSCGMVYSALTGIFNKVSMISSIVANSFSTAGSSMVGQNLGAGKTERVPRILKTILICSCLVSGVMAVVVVLWNQQIFRLFTSDAAVITASSVLIWPILLSFIGSATRSMAFALINGSGNTKLNLAVAIIDGMISRIGFAALLGFVLGLECQGFWFGDDIAGCMPFVIGITYYLSGKWKTAGRVKRNA